MISASRAPGDEDIADGGGEPCSTGQVECQLPTHLAVLQQVQGVIDLVEGQDLVDHDLQPALLQSLQGIGDVPGHHVVAFDQPAVAVDRKALAVKGLKMDFSVRARRSAEGD